VVARFASERGDSLPVVGDDGALLGVVAALDVEQALQANGGRPSRAAGLVREGRAVRAGDSLEEAIAALAALAASDDDGLPVLSDDRGRLFGWLSHRHVLGAYRARVAT
jgi:CBS domain-containing protein